MQWERGQVTPRLKDGGPCPPAGASALASAKGRGGRGGGGGAQGSQPASPRFLLDAPRCAQRPHGGERSAGWRAHMEDAHCAWLALSGLPQGWAFFAVLDGHGGARAALFGARHLPSQVLEALGPAPGEPEGVCGVLRLAFWGADARLHSL